jgi:hypothetical protein
MLEEAESPGGEVTAKQLRLAAVHGDADALLAAEVVSCSTLGVRASLDDRLVAEPFESQLHCRPL